MFGFTHSKNKMKREIIVNAESLETRVAILESGKVEEFKIEHPTEEKIVGNIYKGKIQNLEAGLRASFVDIGLNKNAFIHYWDMIPEDSTRLAAADGNRPKESRRRLKSHEQITKLFPVGSDIVVQVTKGPIARKGPRVTANISLPGRYLVLLPGSMLKGISRKIEDEKIRQKLKKVVSRLPVPENTGLIVRTVAAGVNQRNIVRDMRALVEVWGELQRKLSEESAPCCVYEEPGLVEQVVRDWLTEDVDRIVVDSREKFDHVKNIARAFGRRIRSRIQLYEGDAPVFEHFDVERQMEEALRRKVNLKSGGHIVFEETEALIAIDVNTSRHKAKSQDEAILEVNIEAVEEVARQLRLRNVGGLVMIDLIDMRLRKHQNTVYRTFRAALRKDKARTNALPISRLGILEMSRQRVDESIQAAMYVDCPYCSGRGQVRSPLSMSVEIQRQIAAVMRRQRGSKRELKLQIIVHPLVLERLKEKDEKILMEMQSQFARHLTFKTSGTMHREDFSILNGDSGEVVYSTTAKGK